MSVVHLITPALAVDNNGNWQTARRWMRYLGGRHKLCLATSWEGRRAMAGAASSLLHPSEMMIALHARRSAGSIAAFVAGGHGPVALVMTGTDLYRDIHADAQARASLDLASLIVVLHEQGIQDLPESVRHKARVIFQSARTLKPLNLRRPRRHFDIVMVGHLRAEKDPMTALRAMARLDQANPVVPRPGALSAPVRLVQIGGDRDEALGLSFRQGAASLRNVRRLGPLPHARTRQCIRHAQALVLPSLMEGGANVLIEAACAGVPVLASRISGSVGMLGADYEGFFEVGDDEGLARLIRRCQNDATYHLRLQQQCQARSGLFAISHERDCVRQLVESMAAIQGQ